VTAPRHADDVTAIREPGGQPVEDVRRLPESWHEQEHRTVSTPVEDLQAHSAGRGNELLAVRGLVRKALRWRRSLRSCPGRQQEDADSDEYGERLARRLPAMCS